MESEAKIILDEEVIPYALSVPRRVAAAGRQPLLDKPQRMELSGVIIKSKTQQTAVLPVLWYPKRIGNCVCV